MSLEKAKQDVRDQIGMKLYSDRVSLLLPFPLFFCVYILPGVMFTEKVVRNACIAILDGKQGPNISSSIGDFKTDCR